MQKRQKRSFTPTSDDGDLVVPVTHNDDVETPTPENPPLIRQAVGFSWTPCISANVNTYQATVAPQVVPYFLPGQAPPPPPKPKPTKPRSPRKKKGAPYTDQTGRFKISGSNLSSSPGSGSASLVPTSTENSAGTSPSSGPSSIFRSMVPSASHASGYANGNATAGPSNAVNGATTNVASIAPRVGVKQTKKPSKRKAPASINDYNTQPSARPSLGQPSPIGTSVTPQHPTNGNPRGPPAERPGQALDLQITYSTPPGAASGGTPVGSTNECKYH